MTDIIFPHRWGLTMRVMDETLREQVDMGVVETIERELALEGPHAFEKVNIVYKRDKPLVSFNRTRPMESSNGLATTEPIDTPPRDIEVHEQSDGFEVCWEVGSVRREQLRVDASSSKVSITIDPLMSPDATPWQREGLSLNVPFACELDPESGDAYLQNNVLRIWVKKMRPDGKCCVYKLGTPQPLQDEESWGDHGVSA